LVWIPSRGGDGMSSSRLMQMAAAGGSGGGGWDISLATFGGEIPRIFVGADVGGTSLSDIKFSTDGTKIYVIRGTTIYRYDLASPYDLTSPTYVQSLNVSSRDTQPSGLFFKPDGTRMYVVGKTNDDGYEYSLSTAWDLATATYVTSADFSSEDTSPGGGVVKPDGTRFYLAGGSTSKIHQATMFTAWSFSLVYLWGSVSVTQTSQPSAVYLKPDGTKMYVVGSGYLGEYNLSTAWDVTTATYVGRIGLSGYDSTSGAVGLSFNPDGTECIISSNEGKILKLSFGTAWSVSTASVVFPAQDYISVSSKESQVFGVTFSPDGSRMYLTGNGGGVGNVHQYALSAAWQVSSATFVRSFSVSSQETTPECVTFKPDGTKMYIVGGVIDGVREYNLGTAWDISTAAYSQGFSTSAKEGQPSGISFKSDGTSMYVIGPQSDAVHQYDLSTAWSVASATFVRSFSVSSQTTSPSAVYFKADGTKMYVIGLNDAKAYEYALSSPWNISTSVLESTLRLFYDGSPTGLAFKSNGKMLFVVGRGKNEVVAYDL